MGDIVTFRPRAPQTHVPPAPSPAETRRMIEEATQTALDTADSLLAILDRMGGDVSAEDAAERVGAPESVLQDMPATPTVLPFAPLPWRGAGNVVAAAGVALLSLVGER